MVGARRAPTRRSGVGFAPGHITGVFSPDTSPRDPRARGSTGVGLVLDRGVHAHAEWDPSGPNRTRVRGDVRFPLPISLDVARRLRANRPGRLDVSVSHDLPVGEGFGMSAAGALAVALAVGAVFRVPRDQCVQVAHLADLFGRGGLGGVAAILGGGVEVRARPGVPPWGLVYHRIVRAPLMVGVAGPPLPTAGPLADDRFLGRVRLAARPRLRRLGTSPPLSRFFDESLGFATELGLASPALRHFLKRMSRAGVRVTQAMFGNAFVAWLDTRSHRELLHSEVEDLGWRTFEVSLARRGGTRRPV